jgi:hypothetical protein
MTGVAKIGKNATDFQIFLDIIDSTDPTFKKSPVNHPQHKAPIQT